MKPSNEPKRVSRGQSKLGCFTCRDRKVKCDEEKPVCQKCQKLGLPCDGYPPGAYGIKIPQTSDQSSEDAQSDDKEVDPSQSVVTSFALPSGHHNLKMDSETHTFVQAGLNLLLNSYGEEHTIGQNALRRLIGRYVTCSPAVNAACAALGAAIESEQDASGSTARLNFPKYYEQALELHKKESYNANLDMNTFLANLDMNTFLASCILLSATETILRKQQTAMELLHTASRLFQSSISNNELQAESASQRSATLSSRDDFDKDFLLRIFEINTLAYTHGTRSPSMEPTSLDHLADLLRRSPPSSTALDRIIVHTVHAAFVIIYNAINASQEIQMFASVSTTQNRCADLLRQCISILSAKITNEVSAVHRVHWLTARNLCISTKIQLSTIFEVQEKAWDRHAASFQLLISSAEQVLQHRLQWKAQNAPQQSVGFTTQIGVLGSLYLAAVKYRNSKWRRRAIQCLQHAEREGPWIGKTLGLTSERIIDLEELHANGTKVMSSRPTQTDNIQPGLDLDVNDIPEHSRVSFASVKEEIGAANNTPWLSAGSEILMIEIFKRRKPTVMFPVLLQHSNAESSMAGSKNGKLDPNVWEKWHEQIEFRSGQRYRVLTSTGTMSEPCGGDQ